MSKVIDVCCSRMGLENYNYVKGLTMAMTLLIKLNNLIIIASQICPFHVYVFLFHFNNVFKINY
jgi:hypothetical protein